MKKLLTKLDEWAGKAINFIRPGNKNANVLTDNVHVKEKQPEESNSSDNNKITRRERQNVVMPDEYIVTRTGQMLRKPLKADPFPHTRPKFQKRTK